MNGQYKPGDIVLYNWKLTDLLGEGSYGRVFKAEREDFGKIYTSAIKIITIPQNQSEVDSIRAEGMSEESVTSYFHSLVEDIVNEFALMSQLKGTANIVSYEDHAVVKHSEGIGWDIFIRMELLTPLTQYLSQNTITYSDIIKIGIDINRALELCQKYNIIHRDIKPENIFVSNTGDFKLGDFGIARIVEKTTSGLSKKGTYTYMAPEMYRGDAYGSSVDIYSLGLVLYRLLNDNRAPFLPEYPIPISHSDREAAISKRISGAVLPKPKNADNRLSEIILNACAFYSANRYSSPVQMREELESILYERVNLPDGEKYTESKQYEGNQQNKSVKQSDILIDIDTRRKKTKSRKSLTILILIVIILLLVPVTIKIYENTSQSRLPVPDLIGLAQKEAIEKIEDWGFIADIIEQNSNTVRRGIVISQSPATGGTLAPGSTVIITVSLGG